MKRGRYNYITSTDVQEIDRALEICQGNRLAAAQLCGLTARKLRGTIASRPILRERWLNRRRGRPPGVARLPKVITLRSWPGQAIEYRLRPAFCIRLMGWLNHKEQDELLAWLRRKHEARASAERRATGAWHGEPVA